MPILNRDTIQVEFAHSFLIYKLLAIKLRQKLLRSRHNCDDLFKSSGSLRVLSTHINIMEKSVAPLSWSLQQSFKRANPSDILRFTDRISRSQQERNEFVRPPLYRIKGSK